MLSRYSLAEAPDLAALGLKLVDGVYRWDPPRDPPHPDSRVLAELIERSLRDAQSTGLRRERLERLGRVYDDPQAGRELQGLTDRQLAVLSVISEDPERAGQPESTARLRQLAARLRAVPDEGSADALSSFFDDHEGRGGGGMRAAVYWVRSSDPLDRLRHSFPRHDPAPERRRGLRTREPPAPGADPGPHAVLSAVTNSDLSPFQLKYSYSLDGYMERRDPAEIARFKEKLTQLAGFEHPRTRAKALYLLGLLHDEALVPLFLKHLSEERGEPQDAAARAIGSVIGTYKASSPGADWSAYLEKAPPLLGSLAAAPRALSSWEARRVIVENLGHLNLMSEGQKTRFVGSFQDPRLPLLLIGASASDGIDEMRGLHSPEARRLFERFKTLNGGRPLAETLAGGERDAVGRVLARLQRYDLLAAELKADPRLSALSTGLMFGAGSRPPALAGADTFSLGKLLRKTQGEAFARDLIDGIRGPQDAGFEKKAALLYLALTREELPDGQKEQVRALARERLPEEIQRKVEAQFDVGAPFYKHWPKDGMDVSLVMTQAEHAYDFIRALERNGFRRAGTSRSADTVQHIRLTSGPEGRKVRLNMDILPSNPAGWGQDKVLLEKILQERYQDPGNQVVAYRGHGGQYSPESLARLKAKGKVFIDLSCNSDWSTRRVIEGCEDCGFYGTTTTGRGVVNNAFLTQVLQALAARESYGQIERRLQRALPSTSYGFTGSSSRVGTWEELMFELGLMHRPAHPIAALPLGVPAARAVPMRPGEAATPP